MIITGGGSGIGRATARRFAARGDRVLVVGRTAGLLDETAEGHDGVRTLVADITEPGAGEAVVEAALEAFGRVDVLVNNAGAGTFAPLAALDRAVTEHQIAVNLIGPAFVAQAALAALEATGGTIVNVSSAGSLGIQGFPDNSVYWATKAALNHFTRTWAVELAPRGIRVVSVAPGVTDTGIGERAGMSAEEYKGFLAQIAERIPLGRVATPEDVAWWVTALAEPGGGYLTGAVVPVDGGLSLT
ncbi:SDR family oxidoreductase [Streptomyces sp. ICN441]|uniref:KR domain-containing protein n=1 Tax=Streptomyces tirandamycinicus TaxID=2174846 RepID=A0A2S1T0L7_9ACTN|nr:MULTISPECIES: SDR family oxidoreductase [Streptomyces]AWI32188.1 KR domain-containing protein [Streptomyces tirandamycinicus]MCY0979855.1 SDR family oxidoreductase [Streptomyces tirandamycinicus]NNJ05109.1 SDR family oxidoreductase [Streptomyces sp. PKU-MA01144]TFE36345.1 SDR family oxidoreductase [Streptomyces sp. ICN441]